MKVRPFGVSCTKGEEEGWATKLCDHIILFTSFFVPKGFCPTKRRSKAHGMVSHMRIWNLVELGKKGRDCCGEGVFKVEFKKHGSNSLAMMVHDKVVQVVAKSRVLAEPVIMVSHKVQYILLHADFMNTWLL